MAQKQIYRAPILKTVGPVYQDDASSAMSESTSLHEEDQAVEEKQSYAMVTGLLQVLVASIAFQRDLFPKSCFEMRLPSTIRTETHRSCEQADARSVIPRNEQEMAHFADVLAQRGLPLMVLAPGKTNGVDKLLTWLDEVFEGLINRSLDGVQFSIYADKSRPSHVLELYTFSFQYRNGKNGERRLIGLTAPSSDSGTITTRSVRSSMVNVIDQLHGYQQELPALPKERYMMCHLFHSPNAPWHRRPPGFHSCMESSIAVIENALWQMKQRSFGSIDSGTHRVRLGISFMARTDIARDCDDRSELVQNMMYTGNISRNLNPYIERHFQDQIDPPVGKWMTKQPGGSFTGANKEEDLNRLGELSQGGKGVTSESGSGVRRTIIQETLNKGSGEESFPIHESSKGSHLLPTQVMDARDPPALLMWSWKLRALKKMELRVKREKQQWTIARYDRTVRCECSCIEEEPSMLRCICCQNLQHYHCYGFSSEMHVHEHYCYQCLLEDTHAKLLGDMKSLAIFRRALWILYEEAPSSPAEFARKLHLNGETTQELIKKLDEGGYLASGRVHLSPVTTHQQTNVRRKLYNNPLTSISGFYELQETSSSASTHPADEEHRCKRMKT